MNNSHVTGNVYQGICSNFNTAKLMPIRFDGGFIAKWSGGKGPLRSSGHVFETMHHHVTQFSRNWH